MKKTDLAGRLSQLVRLLFLSKTDRQEMTKKEVICNFLKLPFKMSASA